ncbi:MAG: allantoate amidohydrolase [Candidatus Dormibacteraeota bacterium]|nr:allantoate amidohydrolase [Candidatus Dormibacteraeota bacterium]
MSVSAALADTAMKRCDILGALSDEPDRLTRAFAGPAMRAAHERVREWMQEAGMEVRTDNVGNLRGRSEGAAPSAPTLMLGSHLDTVRDAGKYDGPLGVVVAIAAVQRLHDAGTRLPFAIEVIAFADEEGARFSSTYLGSRAVAGTLDLGDLDRIDAAGITMSEAIRAFGGDPARLPEDGWRGDGLLGYCEVHIEQGPVLEARGLPVGVVSAIAGQARYRITFTGEAGHAGTVPMRSRRDALGAASEFVLAVEAAAGSHEGAVATVGHLTVHPGAANVIPGEVALSLDIRHPEDGVRFERTHEILERAEEIAKRRQIAVAYELMSENPSVQCSPRLATFLARAVEENGLSALSIASGAGHDVVPMSAITDVGMLFIRCKGGVSHNPAESVMAEDVAVAIEVVGKFLELLAAER